MIKREVAARAHDLYNRIDGYYRDILNLEHLIKKKEKEIRESEEYIKALKRQIVTFTAAIEKLKLELEDIGEEDKDTGSS